MANKLIIHIGMHKTGTTAIQTFLNASKKQLKTYGCLYPKTNKEPLKNRPKHSSVLKAACRIHKPNAQQFEREKLLMEFHSSGCHTMLLSNEGFGFQTKKCVEFFKPFISEFEISVICYLKRQDLLIESLYSQFTRELQRKESRTIIEFINSNHIRKYIDYHDLLSQWRNITNHLIVYDFDTVVKTTGLLNSFTKAIDIHGIDNKVLNTINSSPDIRTSLLMAYFNKHQLNVDPKIIVRAAKAVQELNNSDYLKKEKRLLGKQLRNKILKDYQVSNNKLHRDYGVKFSDEMYKDEAENPTTEVSKDYCMALIAEMSTFY